MALQTSLDKVFLPGDRRAIKDLPGLRILSLSNEEFDLLLSKNVVFVDMIAASANNAIIDCITRATPLLINPLPSVQEYLGKDYPFYFRSMSEAEEKLRDEGLIRAAHIHLSQPEIQQHIKLRHFVKRFASTTVYRSLTN